MNRLTLTALLIQVNFFTSLAQTPAKLIVKNKVDHLENLAREPMVAQHPNGDLYVTGFRNNGDIPQLWKSTDMGYTWKLVDVGTFEDGAQGNSDVDLMIDDDGNIYLLSMTYTKFPENLEGFDFSTVKGTQVTLGISRDEGRSWKWQFISQSDYDDRPWITNSSNGNLHIIWNDGKGVHYSISTDLGETWKSQADVYPKGGSSFLSAGNEGRLAVRVAPISASGVQLDKEVDLARISLNHGQSWVDVEIPGERTWEQDLSGVPRWVEPLVWDKNNRLFLLWNEGAELKLGVSSDQGKSWKEHLVMNNPDTLYFPYMIESNDQLLCTWVSGFGNEIRHHAAVLSLRNDVLQTTFLEPQKLNTWSRFSVGENTLDTGGEYFPIIRLSNGNFGMVTTIQNRKENQLGFTWWELEMK